MMYTKLATVMKAVRLRYTVPFVLLLVAAYLAAIQPWMTNWESFPNCSSPWSRLYGREDPVSTYSHTVFGT